ncbi:MAG: hypothetical protein ACT4QF_07200, partial [Sporichthyaceae bacterium]
GGGGSLGAGPPPSAAPGVAACGERGAAAARGPVHLVVCGWPREHATVLREWTTNPGPRVRLTLA